MKIFYDKKTGRIIGTVRSYTKNDKQEDSFNMSENSSKNCDSLIVENQEIKEIEKSKKDSVLNYKLKNGRLLKRKIDKKVKVEKDVNGDIIP